MQAKDIAELLNEPACAHNAKSKSGCAKPKPGATAGGCSFDGAQIALLPIADVAHIVHGPIACAGSSWDNRGTRSSGPTLYKIGMTTDLTEQDVIMGRSEKRLFHSIKRAIDSYHPAAVFVYNTCVPALAVDAVCKDAAQRYGVPVVPVDCAGFYGTKNLGNRIVGDSMFKYVVGTRDPDPVPPEAQRPGITVHDVNLIGEYNIAGEFWHVLPLLDELGLRILCTLSGDARFHQVLAMRRAEASIVVCAKALLNVARKLESTHGVPFFEGSFYGVTDTSHAFREFARPGRLADRTRLPARAPARPHRQRHVAPDAGRAERRRRPGGRTAGPGRRPQPRQRRRPPRPVVCLRPRRPRTRRPAHRPRRQRRQPERQRRHLRHLHRLHRQAGRAQAPGGSRCRSGQGNHRRLHRAGQRLDLAGAEVFAKRDGDCLRRPKAGFAPAPQPSLVATSRVSPFWSTLSIRTV
jgi:nitrogenase molybdenum-cofactor synthesis protein NifE